MGRGGIYLGVFPVEAVAGEVTEGAFTDGEAGEGTKEPP